MESDEEFDRNYREKQNRNKFRGERQGEGGYSNRSREHRRSRDWQCSERSTSHHYSSKSSNRENYNSRRGKRQREPDDEPYETRKKGPRSPPDSPKRMKLAEDTLPEDHHPGGQTFARPGPHINPNFLGSVVVPNFPTPPNRFQGPPFQFHPMHQWAGPRPEVVGRLLTFKAYMSTQEDDITDDEAQRKYAKYKEEFLRMQVQEFFQEHQMEEWFRQRYHPEELAKVQSEKTEAVKERLEIFMQYQQAIGIDELALDCTETVKLTKFLDNIVILLEGGKVEDIMDTPGTETPANLDASNANVAAKSKQTLPGEDKQGNDGITVVTKATAEDLHQIYDPEEFPKPAVEFDDLIENEPNPGEEIADNANSQAELCRPKLGAEVPQNDTADELMFFEEMHHKSSGEVTENSAGAQEEERFDDFAVSENTDNTTVEKSQLVPANSTAEKPPVVYEFKPRSRLLNLNSIFIRALPPSFTKKEVEVMCRQFDGFIRLALADPTAERNWLRRAWATYEPSVNLSAIVYRMNVLKPRCYSLGVMVNRKLSNRIRHGSPLSAHSRSIRTDVRLAAQLVYCLDRKHRLWDDAAANDVDHQDWTLGILTSKNPLLDDVINYLTEEASAEEDELLGYSDPNDHISDQSLRKLTRFMDRLLIYLRVVHSVDFYQRCEYVNEHHMPNRCGIMHVRGVPDTVAPSAGDVENYCKETVHAITKVFLDPPPEASHAEQLMLGIKCKDTETEKIIDAITKKITEEKLRCDICSKKFKSALFVRKHIVNKHADKLNEVAINVDFFNNYIRDAKRPKPWDPLSPSREKMPRRDLLPMYNQMPNPRGFNNRGGYRPAGHGFTPYGPYGMPGMPQRGGRYPNYRFPMHAAGVMDHYGRPIITYRDLDAPPQDDETF